MNCEPIGGMLGAPERLSFPMKSHRARGSRPRGGAIKMHMTKIESSPLLGCQAFSEDVQRDMRTDLVKDLAGFCIHIDS